MEWRNAPDGRLELTTGSEVNRIVHVFPLRDLPASTLLHITARVGSKDLEIGPQPWDDGRMFLEWTDADGRLRRDPIISSRGTRNIGPIESVIPSRIGPATAAIRLEHLGRSGTFFITQLEIKSVLQRPWWTPAAWVLFVLWGGVGFMFCRAISVANPARLWIAAIIWVGMLAAFVMPGPWPSFRPFLGTFHLGKSPPLETGHAIPRKEANPGAESPAQAGIAGSPSKDQSAPTNVVPGGIHEPDHPDAGKVAHQGSWILKVKVAFASIRPLLHSALLLFPTLLLSLLVGPKAGAWLAGSLAILIESMQFLFGYGFDPEDVGDLGADAAGIALGAWLAVLISRRWPWIRPAETPLPAVKRRP